MDLTAFACQASLGKDVKQVKDYSVLINFKGIHLPHFEKDSQLRVRMDTRSIMGFFLGGGGGGGGGNHKNAR